MDQEQINIMQALRDTLKWRDELSVSLIDDNIRLQINYGLFHKAVVQQRKNLEAAIESLRHTPFSVTDTGIDVIRTLVLIRNAIKHLTGEEEQSKTLQEAFHKRT